MGTQREKQAKTSISEGGRKSSVKVPLTYEEVAMSKKPLARLVFQFKKDGEAETKEPFPPRLKN